MHHDDIEKQEKCKGCPGAVNHGGAVDWSPPEVGWTGKDYLAIDSTMRGNYPNKMPFLPGAMIDGPEYDVIYGWEHDGMPSKRRRHPPPLRPKAPLGSPSSPFANPLIGKSVAGIPVFPTTPESDALNDHLDDLCVAMCKMGGSDVSCPDVPCGSDEDVPCEETSDCKPGYECKKNGDRRRLLSKSGKCKKKKDGGDSGSGSGDGGGGDDSGSSSDSSSSGDGSSGDGSSGGDGRYVNRLFGDV